MTVCYSSPFPELIYLNSFDVGDSLINDEDLSDELSEDFSDDVSSENSEKLKPLKYANLDQVLPLSDWLKDPIDCTDNDIIIGNLEEANNHPGNQKFKAQIAANRHKQIYQSLSKSDRLKIVEGILEIMKEENMRFLEYNEILESWREVIDERAKQEIELYLNESIK